MREVVHQVFVVFLSRRMIDYKKVPRFLSKCVERGKWTGAFDLLEDRNSCKWMMRIVMLCQYAMNDEYFLGYKS